MKASILSLAASLFCVFQSQAQIVVQQQTTTYTTTPGFQMQFNTWNPLQQQQQLVSVWDPITNQFILVPAVQQQPVVYVDQFGNPIQNIQQQQQPVVYVDQFGNPIQNFQQQQQPVVYVDQFGNPIQNFQQQQQPVVYVDQFGNPIQNFQQQQQPVVYVDQFGNPVQQNVYYNDPAICNPVTTLHPNYIQPTNVSPVNAAVAMNQGQFSQVLSQIKNQSFESTRLTLTKQIIGSNWFTSEQVRQIMTQMSFEDTRVEIARFAYNRVLDPQNYFVVNSAFSFSSSVDELNQYLFGR